MCVCVCVCVSLFSYLSECVQLIMEDAKKKKKDRQQQLHDIKLKSLLQLRDSLMAAASIHMMGVDDKAPCGIANDQVGDSSLFLLLQWPFVFN